MSRAATCRFKGRDEERDAKKNGGNGADDRERAESPRGKSRITATCSEPARRFVRGYAFSCLPILHLAKDSVAVSQKSAVSRRTQLSFVILRKRDDIVDADEL